MTIARDVYNCHFDDLTQVQQSRIFDLVALAQYEHEERE